VATTVVRSARRSRSHDFAAAISSHIIHLVTFPRGLVWQESASGFSHVSILLVIRHSTSFRIELLDLFSRGRDREMHRLPEFQPRLRRRVECTRWLNLFFLKFGYVVWDV